MAQEIVPAAPLWKRRSRALSAMAATDSGLSGLPGLGDAPSVQKEVVGPSIASSTSSIAPSCAYCRLRRNDYSLDMTKIDYFEGDKLQGVRSISGGIGVLPIKCLHRRSVGVVGALLPFGSRLFVSFYPRVPNLGIEPIVVGGQ